jgi:predicted PurR-regulated permease PerM
MNPPHHETRTILLSAAAVVAILLLWALRSVAILVAFAVLLAYVLDPMVSMVERIRFPRGYRLPRPAAAAAVMLAIVIGGVQLVSWATPRLLAELSGFIQGIPSNAERLLVEMRMRAQESGMSSYVDPAIQSARAQLADWLQGLGGAVLGWIAKLFGTLGKIIGLAVLPVLAYYLLAEREDVKTSFLSFIPETAHDDFHATLIAIDRALKSYVRGQTLVSLIMGTTVGLALMLLGFPAVLLLGIIVALGEVLPYIGFLLAALAIALTGYGIDLLHAFLGVAAYAVINFVIGVAVTPRVMARHLKMHPFVVTVSVLAGAELLGPAGAMLALPTAAVLQSLAEQYAPRRVVTTRIATADDLTAGQN